MKNIYLKVNCERYGERDGLGGTVKFFKTASRYYGLWSSYHQAPKAWGFPDTHPTSSSRKLKVMGPINIKVDKSSHLNGDVMTMTDKENKVAKLLKVTEEILGGE